MDLPGAWCGAAASAVSAPDFYVSDALPGTPLLYILEL